MDKKIKLVGNLKTAKLSRRELLKWVNNTVAGKYTQIEELCSGVAYCQMLASVYPGTINLKKVKYEAKYEHEKRANWKLLETAFVSLGVENPIPIDRVLKGSFQHHLDFLRLLKIFCDAHDNSPGASPLAASKSNKLFAEAPDLKVIKDEVKLMQMETKSYQQQIAEIKQFVGQLNNVYDKANETP